MSASIPLSRSAAKPQPARQQQTRLFAVAGSLAVIVARVLADPWLQGSSPFIVFHPAVLSTALYAGPLVGTLMAGLGALAGLYLLTPNSPWATHTPQNVVHLVCYAVAAAIIICLVQADRVSRRREISRSEKENEALRTSEGRYRAIMETVGDGIVLLDPAGCIQLIGPSSDSAGGFDSSHLVGKSIFDVLVHPDDADRLKQAIDECRLSPGKQVFTKYRVRSGPDGWLWKDVSLLNLLEHSAVRAIVCNHRDPTEQPQISDVGLEATRESHLGHADSDQEDEAASEIPSDSLSRIRQMSLNLRPAILDEEGLLAALNWYVDAFTDVTSVSVTFNHSSIDRRFPVLIETGAFLIVREALSNSARHSGAGEVELNVCMIESFLMIRVSDRGRGFTFNHELSERDARGLERMRQRTLALGGGFAIDSKPGLGASMTASIPIRT